jgi:hypothetical protein
MGWAIYGEAINSYNILVGKSSPNFSIYNTVKWILWVRVTPRRYIGRVELRSFLTSTLNQLHTPAVWLSGRETLVTNRQEANDFGCGGEKKSFAPTGNRIPVTRSAEIHFTDWACPVVAESTPLRTKIATGHDPESVPPPVLTAQFCNIQLNVFQI